LTFHENAASAPWFLSQRSDHGMNIRSQTTQEAALLRGAASGLLSGGDRGRAHGCADDRRDRDGLCRCRC
jgi:hypothetical protein